MLIYYQQMPIIALYGKIGSGKTTAEKYIAENIFISHMLLQTPSKK
jgi:tRNA A37 threonylcarbamoyladenosine biosynthesis protein TsaE